ncbi:HAUS augmin-like complex subunit 2 isoform X2 [Syngnathoides biaculeatus]|nr:HAUS augmin-like complex subunit 2 isoform X2 [Syngnathoides biaculeatus]
MHEWTTSPLPVTPSGGLLSALVSSGAVSQEELEHASSSQRAVFSPRLHEAERRLRTREELQQLQLEAALLHEEKKSADVTRAVRLAPRLQALQTFNSHLEDVLRNHKVLARRLARPRSRADLPVPAHLRRSVVEVLRDVTDFVDTLDDKRGVVASGADIQRRRLDQLNADVEQLSAQASEAETWANQLLRRKEARHGSSSCRSSCL